MRRPSIAVLGAAVALSVLVGGIALAGCGRLASSNDPQLQMLAAKQVNNYKGEKLGSITDLQENSIKGPQNVDIATYRLNVFGDVSNPLSLSYDQVLAMPAYQKVVTLNCVEGWSVKLLWQGVKLSDLLQKAGSNPNANVVIFRAVDGYSDSLPIDYVRNNDILMAYKENGVELPKSRGFPFQVVAEDRWGYKWVKWIQSIEVTTNANFRGYWEQRGYDNTALTPGAKK